MLRLRHNFSKEAILLKGIGPCVLKGNDETSCKAVHVNLSGIDSLTGSLSQFGHGFERMRVLNLKGCAIEGELTLKSLALLGTHNANLRGCGPFSLASPTASDAFIHSPELVKTNLREKHVGFKLSAGTLIDLAVLSELEELNLAGITALSGSPVDLLGFKKIRRIVLRGCTGITGKFTPSVVSFVSQLRLT